MLYMHTSMEMEIRKENKKNRKKEEEKVNENKHFTSSEWKLKFMMPWKMCVMLTFSGSNPRS
jgi:hypothetical protein